VWKLQLLAVCSLFACAVETDTPDGVSSTEVVDVSSAAVPDVRCAGVPDAGPTTGWRNLGSHLIEDLGDAHHRGFDLIASTEAPSQTLGGRITYGVIDTDLEGESVSLFACLDATWKPIGSARTNDNGRFTLKLTGDARFPAGMRDLYVSVDGDRSGAKFLAYVAPPGVPVIAADVDGTLTSSESAYPTSLVSGSDPGVQDNAPQTLMSAAVQGVSMVYISARGDRFTQDTRDWLAEHGFPRGPLILPQPIVTMPGDPTIEFKTSALDRLATFDLLAGFGNRATDVAAYTYAGLAPDRIFIKLPEFSDELAADLAAGNALGFNQYETVRTNEMAAMLAN
jgi:hypothetical protein